MLSFSVGDVLNESGLITKDVGSVAVGSDRLPCILSSDVGCEAVVGLVVGSSTSKLPSPDAGFLAITKLLLLSLLLSDGLLQWCFFWYLMWRVPPCADVG
ncbi:hypothetical protein Nepgr_014821 [Nepenthes gracilis]|uniref:Uncharacterized protein n=1 Tax=Nepenthes gracilis TaxID=150966 RepID=A0AAD3SJY7_NEPGR|nr:hypothetical protein Nepgr_014821 [Nepenthes gracilis]